ncbi:hypothetical protein PS15m_009633 [Mucor circinelloides]
MSTKISFPNSQQPALLAVKSVMTMMALPAQWHKNQQDEATSFDGITYSLLERNHSFINDFDIFHAFHQLQLSIFNSGWKNSLEEHLPLALASTSVLILT